MGDKIKAAQRQADRSRRSEEEQLALLDKRLGVGVGAAKERKRLLAAIENRKGSN